MSKPTTFETISRIQEKYKKANKRKRIEVGEVMWPRRKVIRRR